MKRKITSIALLLSFLGMFTHDMIPHHHHEAIGTEVSSKYSQFESHCNSDQEYLYLDLNCSILDDLLADIHHECPHHYHNCAVKDFEVVNANRTKIPSSGTQNLISGYHSTKFNLSLSSSYIQITYFIRAYQLPKISLKGQLALRAPPSVA